MNRVSAVPMITVRLPVMTANDQESISLSESLQDPQYYLENGVLVPKVQEILYTRGVLIFHVTRRTQIPRYQRMIQPGNWTELLPTISAYEKINNRPVTSEAIIEIGFSATALGTNPVETHLLTSVVALNVSPINPELIIGTCALLVNSNSNSNGMSEQYMIYNPQYAGIMQPGIEVNAQQPISRLEYQDEKLERSFVDLASKFGTIYVYRQEKRNENVINLD